MYLAIVGEGSHDLKQVREFVDREEAVDFLKDAARNGATDIMLAEKKRINLKLNPDIEVLD